MFKLPKSVVLEGRKYPTWTLSQRAREQRVNLQHVDAHIQEIHQRLGYYSGVRALCEQNLKAELHEYETGLKSRCYWQIVSRTWAEEQCIEPGICRLRSISSESRYRDGDRLVIYVKGCGAVGWGEVVLDTHSTQRLFAWRSPVSDLGHALTPKMLFRLGLRHPTRKSQQLADQSKVTALCEHLNSAARPDESSD